MRIKPIHTISLLASAIALALPSTTCALGLGRLTVQSSLGQPLSAQIELTSATKDELDSLAARVADPALYRQNNLAYQGVLARARVTLERSQGGQAYLRVATATPVNEPYLDLMVELNWSSGRVVREYTFLLDPPGIVAAAPAIEPVAPVRGGGSAPRAGASSAALPGANNAGNASSGSAGDGRGRAGDDYTVRRGDSLARIANQLKPDGVSLEQMLVALFQRNPEAFDGNNMNRLRSGAIMKIPTADEVAGTPGTDAARVVRMQASDWRSYRDRVAAGAPVSEAAGSRETGGRITTAVQERTPAATPGRDQVRVSREAGQGKGGGVAEDALARDRALKDAQTRIAELEKTLKDLQRAMEMRSQTMAQLQTQADAGKGKAAEPAKALPPAGTPAVIAPSPKAAEPARAIEPSRTEAAKSEPAAPAKSTEAVKPAEPPAAPTPAATTTSSTSATTTAPAVVPPGKSAPKAPKAEPTPSMIDDVLTNTPSWVMGAGALALLAGFGALLAARRRKTANFEDSIISGTDIKSNTVFGSTGGGIVNTGENSLSSDFSREGLSPIDTDEVDPIAEAEVYLAYGRDAQAEEILKDALKKDPQRQEVHLKLLEIHAQHNKPSSFETVAAELYAVSHGQGEVWHKAVALGRQLDPNNPMFAEDSAGAAAAAAAASAAAMAAMPPEPVAPVRGAEPRAPDVPPIPVGVAELSHERGMNFELDEDISISPTSGGRKKSPGDSLAGAAGANGELEKTARNTASGMPFEKDRTDLPWTAPATGMSVEQRIEAARGGVDPKFDLDFHLDESDKPTPVRAAAAASSLARPQAAIDLDKLDLSFDPDRITFEDPTPSVLDGQWHDAATKLDLAKAYQEMGDVEGAREILQEVLHEGDDQQKGEAGALLAKLG